MCTVDLRALILTNMHSNTHRKATRRGQMRWSRRSLIGQHTATHCINTLQHTATYCNTLRSLTMFLKNPVQSLNVVDIAAR